MKNLLWLLPLTMLGAPMFGASQAPSKERLRSWENNLNDYHDVQKKLAAEVEQRNPNAIFDLQPSVVKIAPIESVITISNNSFSGEDLEKFQGEVLKAQNTAAEAQKELEAFRSRRNALLSELDNLRKARGIKAADKSIPMNAPEQSPAGVKTEASPEAMAAKIAAQDKELQNKLSAKEKDVAAANIKVEELLLKAQAAEGQAILSREKLDDLMNRIAQNGEGIDLLKTDVSGIKTSLDDFSTEMDNIKSAMQNVAAELPYKILDNKGGRFAVVPKWVGKDRSELSRLYPGRAAFVIERSGKNINFVRDLAEIEAFGQISRQISIDMEQRFGLSKEGMDGSDDKYKEAVINIIGGTSRSIFSGLSKESEWWELRSPKNIDGESPKANSYHFAALYTIDQKRLNTYVEEQIRKQLRAAEHLSAPLAASELPTAIDKLTGNASSAPEASAAVVRGNPAYVTRLLKMLKIYEAEDARLR